MVCSTEHPYKSLIFECLIDNHYCNGVLIFKWYVCLLSLHFLFFGCYNKCYGKYK